MTKEALLTYLDEEGVPAAQDLLREQEESRQLQAASRAALKDAAVFGRTNKGRQTFQTILTAHAYDVPEGPSTVPDYRRAQILNVHPAVFNTARQRAKSLQPDLHPATALNVGAYWHRPRARRSDATPPELIKLMQQFWYTPGISRSSGNSRDIFRESKSPTANTHPRQQLIVEGGGNVVFSKFLEWPEFINFKSIWNSEKGEDLKDPGRTLFLSTRSRCLTAPKTDQCACKIHTQQQLYLNALKDVTWRAVRHAIADGAAPLTETRY